jgi:hypothetical protein
MKKSTVLVMLVVTLVICYLCFTHIDKVIRGLCVLLAAVFAFLSFMFYERIYVRLNNKELFETATGKAAFPGSIRNCVIIGTIFLAVAVLFACIGLDH